MQTIFDKAENPPLNYRPVPFWSWNEKLEDEELSRQIQAMYKAGIGGFFMHARGGLLTEYCSDEWFHAIKTTIHESEKLGMNPWCYDENGWPSGFASGAVPKLGLAYQQKYLRFKKLAGDECGKLEHIIAVYRSDLSMISAEEAVREKEVYAAYFEVNPYYVDTLDADVIKKFIEFTHCRYFKELSPAERHGMTGVFTDEPQVSRNGVPWSFKAEAEYQKNYGESLIANIPGLFLETPKTHQTRYRFWRMVTRMFMNAFNKQIFDWCREHDWKYTGHMVLEETYDWQITSNGAVMPQYQYFSIPGVDSLCRHLEYLTTFAQLGSAAAQMGQNQLLSETFALSGWAVDFADLRWMFQWQMVHGINLLCQHLEGYSLRGIRKRDYPASLFHHQPWWDHYKPFNDEVSRTGVLLADGEINVDVLVLHGITTAHMFFGTGKGEKVDQYFKSFYNLSEALEQNHVPFHYGDETLMEQHGFIKGAEIGIGRMMYKVIVMPEISNFSTVQVQQLNEFVKNGGIILGMKKTIDPDYFCVDGAPAGEIEFLKKTQFFDSFAGLIEALLRYTGNISVKSVKSMTEEPAIRACSRTFADFDGKPAEMFYYTNTERYEARDTVLQINAQGLELYDAATGKLLPADYTVENGVCKMQHRFEPAGALIVIARPYAVLPAEKIPAPKHILTASGEFKVKAATENLLTLEFCSCKADGKLLYENEYILTIQDELLKFERDVKTELGFEFETAPDFKPAGPLYLLMERPERAEITLNGIAISNVSQGFFADKAFERLDITSAVRPGKNLLKIALNFHQKPSTYEGIRAARVFESEKNKLTFETELEAVYLCGNFGVKTDAPFRPLPKNAMRCAGPFVITNRPETVQIENLLASGFPFFAGTLTLEKEFETQETEDCLLAFKNLSSIVTEFRINGEKIAEITKPDYAARIPEGLLKAGKNTLELTFITSLRNMLGPFHMEDGESYGVCPGSFYKDPGVFAPEPSEWNSDYCFIHFGAVPADVQ